MGAYADCHHDRRGSHSKLGGVVKLDVMRPLQAYDAGGRARTVTAIVQAMAQAKEAGLDITPALKLVDWKE